MDIFQKMNPFHRPQSRHSGRDRPSIEIPLRASSSLESNSTGRNLPPLHESPNDNYTTHDDVRSLTPHHHRYQTPIPHTPKQTHTRTPSLLRSLAHHPSLSALRSKSRSKKEKKRKSIKGAFTELGSGSSDDLVVGTTSGGHGLMRKLSKRGLKGSKSVPRDLRSGEDDDGVPDFNSDFEMPPPMPSPTFINAHSSRFLRDRTTPTDPHHPSLSQRPAFNRANSATPSIVVQHHDMGTPESVKIRRMKFEIEIESPGKRRARSASTSVGDSPSKLGASGASRRHLSSPAPPGRSRGSSVSQASGSNGHGQSQATSASYPRINLPSSCSQHPHPVPLPLDLTRSPTPGSISSYYLGRDSGRDSDDFAPLTESERWLDDGLDLMVAREELPVGTPGGKKADLKLGAFVDGARREKDAVRFFSRDMYSQLGHHSTPLAAQSDSRQSSSSTFSAPAPVEAKVERKKASHSRRSSSPFEVKLTPTVSKRVSLDAFGGVIAPTVAAEREGLEEVLEDISDMEEGEEDDDEEESFGDQIGEDFGSVPDMSGTAMDVLATFHGTTLSTINEVSSGDQFDLTSRSGIQATRYYTPADSPGDREVVSYSPMLPPRQHRSAPPLTPTRNLLRAHEERNATLDDEIRASMTLISELQAESRRLHDAYEEESEDKRQILLDIGQIQRELLQAEHALHSRDNTINQLRKALDDNEDSFDQIQFELEEALQRATVLEDEKRQLIGFNDTQNEHLIKMDDELRSIQAYTEELWAEKEKSEAMIIELKSSLADVEAQLETTADEYTALLGSHETELANARRMAFEKESLLFVQVEQTRMQVEKIGKLEGELKTTNLILTSKEGEIARLQDKVGQLRFERNEKKFEADSEVRVLKRDLEEKDGEIEQLEEELQGMREERDRADRERGELLHALQDMRQEEEGATQLRETITELESQLSTAEYRVQSLEAELEDRSTLLQNRSNLSSSQGGQIAQLRGQLANAEDALATLRDETIRRQREQAAASQRLQVECQDLREQQTVHQTSYEEALIRAETEKARSEDMASRLETFITELDRVALSETSLREEMAALRKKSASDEMSRMELEKHVARLENDKELLNVALESKQTELALVTRKSIRGAGTVTPTTNRTSSTRTLVSSTSKIQRPPSAMDDTPVAARYLSSSTTSTTQSGVKASRRESSIIAPSPAPSQRSSKPKPLGTSTQHNRTPERQKSSALTAKIVISTSTSKPKVQNAGSTPGTQQHVVGRRSSLPVLRRQPSLAGERMRVMDVREEEEEEDLFAA